ncbi:MAG TPA: hypothetical protein VMK66_04295 [Myxococcales bacterium]|nr:hypothetical protein [Myxococcales bacterium]
MRLRALAILFLAVPRLASAAEPRFPITARVVLSEATVPSCYLREATVPCPDSLGTQTKDALEEAARRMFRPAGTGEEPDLLLEAAARSAGIEGSYAVVTQMVRVRSPADGEIDTLVVRGEAIAFGTDLQAMSAAFAHSARDAAQGFENEFVNSEPVVRWLLKRNIAPVGSTILAPARPDLGMFLEAGGEAVSVPDGVSPGVRAGLGVAGKWFVARATFAKWSSNLNNGGISLTELGIEAGPAWRFHRNWEVRGGGGVQFASGSLGAEDFKHTMPSLFAGIQYDLWPHWSGESRVRFSLEFRTHLDSEVSFLLPAPQVVEIAGPSVGFFVGVELPLLRSREPALGAR